MPETEEFVATGRRKTSVARIRMTPGTGKIDINGRSFEDYFPTVPLQNVVLQPLQTAKAVNTYDLSINATGGGIMGQAGAAQLAIARALLQVDRDLRSPLKAEGLLRRDPRMKERKKSGQPGAPLVLAGYLASTNAVAPWPGWPKNSFDIASGCFRRRAAHRRFGFSPLRCTPATAKPAVRCNCWDTSTQPVGRPPALHRFFPSTPGSQPSPFAPCSKAHVEGIWR